MRMHALLWKVLDDTAKHIRLPNHRRHGRFQRNQNMGCLLCVLRKKGCMSSTVYPKKYAHRFCIAVLCCGYTLTDFPISIRLTSLALWQSNDCPSASKATLMNMDKYSIWIHYERLHNHNKAKHNKTVCIFLGIYCSSNCWDWYPSALSYKWYNQVFQTHLKMGSCRWNQQMPNIHSSWPDLRIGYQDEIGSVLQSYLIQLVICEYLFSQPQWSIN